jgi:hypothetical protein
VAGLFSAVQTLEPARAGGNNQMFPKDTDFGLTNAQQDSVKEVLGAIARKKINRMQVEMAAMAKQGGERLMLQCADGNGGYVAMQVHPFSYHYWGQREGYQCWEDDDFKRKYLRDVPEARVKSRTANPTVLVPGRGGLASLGAKRFSKRYGNTTTINQ